MAPEEFWGKLSAIKDGGGNPQFSTLCNYMHSLLSLPHANVDVRGKGFFVCKPYQNEDAQ